MNAIKPRSAAIFAVGGLFSYFVLAVFIEPLLLRDIFNNMALGVAIMVALTWAPAAFRAFREGADEGKWQLVVAVFLTFCVIIFQRTYAIAVIWFNRPPWLVESAIAGFIPYSITLVGMLFLSAPGIAEGAPKGRYWIHIMFAVAIGSLIAGIMIGSGFTSTLPNCPLGMICYYR